MGVIQHRQLEKFLRQKYLSHIKVEDLTIYKDSDRDSHALSRGVAALAISYLAKADPVSACAAITDCGGDNGIDAVFFDSSEKRLLLIQSKWNNTHSGSVDTAALLKFSRGIKDLLNSKRARFSGPILNRWKEIEGHIELAKCPSRNMLSR